MRIWKTPLRSFATALPIALLTALPVLPGCSTTGGGQAHEAPKPPPMIAWDMPLEEALTAGIDFGDETLANVKRLIKRRKEEAETARLVRERLMANMLKYEHHQLLNAGHLYLTHTASLDAPLFSEMVRSARPLANQIGWQLAAAKPSAAVAAAADAELTRAINDGEEDTVLLPQMANAVAANRMKGSYTLVRRGLMTKGEEEFAAAMATIEPARASEDFLAYLALAPAEELRQLSMASVNPYTCVAILNHLRRSPPSVANPRFEHLFAYAVSRNIGLAELAQELIEGYVPRETEIMAQILTRQPIWVQMAYLESARRKRSSKTGLLVSELRRLSPEEDIVQEIDELKL